MRSAMRGNEFLLLFGLLLALPTLVFPIGIIRGFEVETQPIHLLQQDAVHTVTLLFPPLFALMLFVRRKAIASTVTVFGAAALSMLSCGYIVFLYFRFHFAEPDPTWVSLTFLLGFTLLFLGHLKNLFFPYEFLRAYQRTLPARQQAPPSSWEIWGAALLIVGVMIGFQGYYARFFLEDGPQYLLIIVGTLELTPVQRVQTLLGSGGAACLCGAGMLLWPKTRRHDLATGRN